MEAENREKSVVLGCENALLRALRAAGHIQAQYGFDDDDVRVATLANIGNAINTTVISLYCLHNQLKHDHWWQDTFGDNLSAVQHTIPETVNRFEIRARDGLVADLAGVADESMRLILHAIWPGACKGARSPFDHIYPALLGKLDLGEDRPIYEMIHLIQLAAGHRGWRFYPRSGKNVEVSYRHQIFAFNVGEPFQCSWSLAISLTDDLIDSMVRLVTTSPVVDEQGMLANAQR
jgi:hypothetical protein